FPGAVFDPPSDRMIIFAGFAPPTNTLYNDTWALSGANGVGTAAWTHLSTTGGPPGERLFPLAVFTVSSGRMTIWGGGATSNFNDVWVLSFDNQPASKDACKGGGWRTLRRADGSSFKNQGDCIQYVNTGK